METTFTYQVAGAIQCGVGGPFLGIGDRARLFLDQNAAIGLPEFLDLKVATPPLEVLVIVDDEPVAGTQYEFAYHTEDLNGALPELLACHVSEAVCVSCCATLNQKIDDVKEELEGEIERLDGEVTGLKEEDLRLQGEIDTLGGRQTNADGRMDDFEQELQNVEEERDEAIAAAVQDEAETREAADDAISALLNCIHDYVGGCGRPERFIRRHTEPVDTYSSASLLTDFEEGVTLTSFTGTQEGWGAGPGHLLVFRQGNVGYAYAAIEGGASLRSWDTESGAWLPSQPLLPKATQAEAEEGTWDFAWMTPFLTLKAIDAAIPPIERFRQSLPDPAFSANPSAYLEGFTFSYVTSANGWPSDGVVHTARYTSLNVCEQTFFPSGSGSPKTSRRYLSEHGVWSSLQNTEVILSQEIGTSGDSTLAYLSPTIGADFTGQIQEVLDRALTSPLYLLWDGRYSVTGLTIHPNTHILAAPGCGAVLRPDSNNPLFQNASWKNNYGPKDENIVIDGGIWHCNGLEQTREGNDGMWTVGMRFANVRNLHLRNLEIRVQTSFALHSWEAEDVFCENLIIDDGSDHGVGHTGNTDGLHFQGVKNLWVRNLYASTGDDAIALNADDWATVLGDHAVAGDILNVHIDGVIAHDCLEVLRVLSAHRRIDNVLVENVTGTAERAWVIDARGESYNGMASRGVGNIGRVQLKNWKVDCRADNANRRMGGIEAVIDDLSIEMAGSYNTATAIDLIGDVSKLNLNLDIEAARPTGNVQILQVGGRVGRMTGSTRGVNLIAPRAESVILNQAAQVSELLGIRDLSMERLEAVGLAHVLKGNAFYGNIKIESVKNTRTLGSYGAIYASGANQTRKSLMVGNYQGTGSVNGNLTFTTQRGAALSATELASINVTDFSDMTELRVHTQPTGNLVASDFRGFLPWAVSGAWAGEYYGYQPENGSATLSCDLGKDGDFELRATVFFKLGGSMLLMARFDDQDNWLGVRVTDSALQLISKADGAETLIGSCDISHLTPRPGDWSSVRVIFAIEGLGAGGRVMLNPAHGSVPTRVQNGSLSHPGNNTLRIAPESGEVMVGSLVINSL